MYLAKIGDRPKELISKIWVGSVRGCNRTDIEINHTRTHTRRGVCVCVYIYIYILRKSHYEYAYVTLSSVLFIY
jgi:hypothetical protein